MVDRNRGGGGNMQIEKEKQRPIGAEKGQEKEPIEAIPGDTARDTEGDKENDKPIEESLPDSNALSKNRVSQGNISLGYTNISNERGDLGQLLQGLIPSATKFYIRRKEALEISGKVQINMESIMDSKTVSDVDLMTRNKGDLMVTTITEDTEYDLNSNHQDNNIGQVNNNKHAILEKQCALVKDMGLTHSEG